MGSMLGNMVVLSIKDTSLIIVDGVVQNNHISQEKRLSFTAPCTFFVTAVVPCGGWSTTKAEPLLFSPHKPNNTKDLYWIDYSFGIIQVWGLTLYIIRNPFLFLDWVAENV